LWCESNYLPSSISDLHDNWPSLISEQITMQAFHLARAKALLAYADEIVDEDAAKAAVAKVAEKLNLRFGNPEEEHFPLVLGVMGGAVVFTGQLLPQLRFPLEFDYIHVSRYTDEPGGRPTWKVVPRPNVAGRTIVLLDDILDEGETLAQVKQRLLEMGAAEVVIAVFADKAHKRVKPVKADIVGVNIPNRFVVGFGMDVDGYWRNLPGLWAIRTEDLKPRDG
jgi:hypoxanthine phosphoribosyltransferase